MSDWIGWIAGKTSLLLGKDHNDGDSLVLLQRKR